MLIGGFAFWQISVALVAALISAFVRGLTGFGMAILLVPVLALALQPIEAVLVANSLGLALGLIETPRLISQAERSARPLSAIILMTTLPGMALLAVTPPPVARLLIAVIAATAFVAVLLPPRAADIPGRTHTMLTGASAGLLTGFAGMPGPPIVPFYVGRSISRHTAKASMVLVFTTACGAGIASGLILGKMHWRLALLAGILLPVVFGGNALGVRALGRISERSWRIFAATVLGLAALAALLKLR